jgi:hypothetical protein
MTYTTRTFLGQGAPEVVQPPTPGVPMAPSLLLIGAGLAGLAAVRRWEEVAGARGR